MMDLPADLEANVQSSPKFPLSGRDNPRREVFVSGYAFAPQSRQNRVN
jgi:hypothetical protein